MAKRYKKNVLIALLAAAAVTSALVYLPDAVKSRALQLNGKEAASLAKAVVSGWKSLSANRRGKIIFARPPKMFCLDLNTGIEKEVPGVRVAGAPGRKMRGQSPQPFWSPDGQRFVYRFDNRVYVCAETGRKRVVINERMDCSAETRWSWYRDGGSDWLAGPSTDKNVILVKVSDPVVVKTAYGGGNVAKHCEITGTGNYVVYDDGSHIRITRVGSSAKGIVISQGQSCRPCAAADDRAAWLPSPHSRYRIYNAANGQFLQDLLAPPDEELYRLNWSNEADFAVHADGAGSIVRMHVRKISTGAYLFVGYGWDPDLWIGN